MPNTINSCVSPRGRFVWGLHTPRVGAHNFRSSRNIRPLGRLADGTPMDNRANYPEGHLHPVATDPIFEIPNAFPFRGRTYIIKPQADRQARDISAIALPPPEPCSMSDWIMAHMAPSPDPARRRQLIASLPKPVQLALAATSSDGEDLMALAHLACAIQVDDESEMPGLGLHTASGEIPRPVIHQPELFKVLINNPHLPDAYKVAMVLRPGIQGSSPIVGEIKSIDQAGQVNEYLRHNSYIPWGHYAANMADDAIRYRIEEITPADVRSMRRLYYQRTYARLGAELGLAPPVCGQPLSLRQLEDLRTRVRQVLGKISDPRELRFNSTLWGWNLGFDFSPTGYRLHASHQQVHQQFALVPATVAAPFSSDKGDADSAAMPAYHCGTLIQQFIADYRRRTGRSFFEAYLKAIAANGRTDGRSGSPRSLVIWATSRVMLVVPKAQTSQWELQVMAIPPVGNILEADPPMREDLDRALWLAVHILGALGARMITSIEYGKQFLGGDSDQRLLYALLPKMPYSPGSFTEAQLRWINGHYPEDFAEACRRRLPD